MSVASQLESATDLLKVWGFITRKRAGWASKKARSDIAFAPKGVIFHHTAAWTTSDVLLFDTGNGKVKGPLCHFAIDKSGCITLGAAGYANHAGINNKAAVAKVLAGGIAGEVKPGGDTAGYSANRSTVGVEVKCPGAYNEAQRKASVALAAALVMSFGWTHLPVGAHKEITRRKPGDPGDNMAAFRAEVLAFIAAKTAPPVPTIPSSPPVTPPPPVVPNPAKTVAVRVGIANCQSYDGDKSNAAWKARAVLMADQDADLWLVQESTEAGRAVMLSTLGKSWRVWTLNGKTVAILFNSKTLSYGKMRQKWYGTSFGHGAIAVPFKKAGIGFDAICQHTRPQSVATDKQKDGDIRAGSKLSGVWPAIYGGDFARNKPWLPDWTRATPVLDTMDKAGNQSCDAAFIKGKKITSAKPKLVDPGRLSDHKWWVVPITVTA